MWSHRELASMKGDFLFETYVLVRLLGCLVAAGWKLTFRHNGARGMSLPRKPAKKSEGWASFVVTKGSQTFEICAGTSVADIDDKHRHPDISVQEPVGIQTPTLAHMRGLFDAKHRADGSSRITSHEFAEFARWVDLFGQSRSSPPWPDVRPFEANALVTNGKESTEFVAELKRRGVREISGFGPKQKHKVRP